MPEKSATKMIKKASSVVEAAYILSFKYVLFFKMEFISNFHEPEHSPQRLDGVVAFSEKRYTNQPISC